MEMTNPMQIIIGSVQTLWLKAERYERVDHEHMPKVEAANLNAPVIHRDAHNSLLSLSRAQAQVRAQRAR